MKCKQISLFRLHALAGYNLQPLITVLEEDRFFSCENDRILGLTFQHPHTSEFGSLVLCRDSLGCYQTVHTNPYTKDSRAAERTLMDEMIRLASESPPQPKKLTRLSITTLSVPQENLGASFKRLLEFKGFSPAHELIEKTMGHFEDPDGTYIREFQTTSFDARLWELYIYLALVEDGLNCTRPHRQPDFFVAKDNFEFCVEAVTANPAGVGEDPEPGMPEDIEEARKYLKEYVPVKFGRPLCNKLKAKYWNLPHVSSKPLVFAIQDFHFPGAMSVTGNALGTYLYGLDHTARVDEHGDLVAILASEIKSHKYGRKSICSGFFALPGAEHVTAVITNPTATINKFNRIGFIAGFGDRTIKMLCIKELWDLNPKAAVPKIVVEDVNNPDYFEPWGEGLNVYHNPYAISPLPEDIFRLAAHHRLEGDQILSTLRGDYHPKSSKTAIIVSK